MLQPRTSAKAGKKESLLLLILIKKDILVEKHGKSIARERNSKEKQFVKVDLGLLGEITLKTLKPEIDKATRCRRTCCKQCGILNGY